MPAAGASSGNQGGSTRAQHPVTATGLDSAADGRRASAEVSLSPSQARSRRAGCLNWASPDLREAQRVTAGPTRPGFPPVFSGFLGPGFLPGFLPLTYGRMKGNSQPV